MINDSRAARRVAQTCAVWDTAIAVEQLPQVVVCRTGVSVGEIDAETRFCFVSVASPIEHVLGSGSHVIDRDGRDRTITDLTSRLLDREVAAVVATGVSVTDCAGVSLPTRFVERRSELRRTNVLLRFLLRQIGLEEVSSHRGAPVQLYDDIARMWSTEVSLFTDPAMLLTLGADRQRYVDSNYTDRATDRLPRALGRLHDLGVRSYPRLVIV